MFPNKVPWGNAQKQQRRPSGLLLVRCGYGCDMSIRVSPNCLQRSDDEIAKREFVVQLLVPSSIAMGRLRHKEREAAETTGR